MPSISISSNEDLLETLESECSKFTDRYFPLHTKQIASLKAATALVNTDQTQIHRNPGKRRAATILTDLWTHAQEVFVLCALATNQTGLGALKTIDYIAVVGAWWEARETKPRGLSEIIHYHSNILPTTRGSSDFITVNTTVAQLASLMLRENGNMPLIITCPFGGVPPPFIQIGQEPRIKVELSMEAFTELLKVADEGSIAPSTTTPYHSYRAGIAFIHHQDSNSVTA
ncbi:hypothetical protein AK830_g4189 [Neonectria ditissima]|uniref:Uncharacterized protein n=1 Tax=Neonectria ditissima TaxID=78410 RepID=A0A0P7B6Z3_9HYPO|nr:hypothetical protein AK830_g4189 [Neonectria ditissima]